ncbi:uncharacterized protein LOC111622256 isoform X1 [Centruroides sculpturatus]|uniref:uncharacterized protein LOC111622256 isoform X1 n=1 Tax=Centruroides sculpturatus TaxID=218467 RepID=UPI000C6ED4CC|nr:uncharacterized protein LOC111622256 isoform X1 [Centruroides sculpturatus]
MTEIQAAGRITFCGECGFTAEYEAVLQHFQDQHGVKGDGSSNSEVTIIETPNLVTEEPVDITSDYTDAERNIIQWTKASEAKLVNLVKEKEEDFNSPYIRKKQLWKIISDELASKHNIIASAAQCDNKWKSITRRLRKQEERNREVKFLSSEEINHLKKLKANLLDSEQISDDSNGVQVEEQTSTNDNISPSSPPSEEVSVNALKKQLLSYKRPRDDSFSDEPRWFKQFRVECQKRHEERIELQNKLLEQHRNLMMQLILTMANMKK